MHSVEPMQHGNSRRSHRLKKIQHEVLQSHSSVLTYARRAASAVCTPIGPVPPGLFFWAHKMDVVELLKRHEGFSRTPYRCTAGKMTIGYGRNLESQGISEAEAEWLLKRDVDRAISNLRNEAYWLDLSDVRQAVLIDMVFNLGWAGFTRFQRLRMALNRADYDAAANEMRASAWFKQVGTRSQTLVVMMQTGLWPRA